MVSRAPLSGVQRRSNQSQRMYSVGTVMKIAQLIDIDSQSRDGTPTPLSTTLKPLVCSSSSPSSPGDSNTLSQSLDPWPPSNPAANRPSHSQQQQQVQALPEQQQYKLAIEYLELGLPVWEDYAYAPNTNLDYYAFLLGMESVNPKIVANSIKIKNLCQKILFIL